MRLPLLCNEITSYASWENDAEKQYLVLSSWYLVIWIPGWHFSEREKCSDELLGTKIYAWAVLRQGTC